METNPARRNTKPAKKKILIAFAIILGVLLLLTCAAFLIDYIENADTDIPNSADKEIDYNFYPPDFEEDIFENQDYLTLFNNGFMDFKEGNVTIGITKDNASKYGADTSHVVEMLYSIINGDNDLYNQHFSDLYYKTHAAKDDFTMQMLYDIRIERISAEKIEIENTPAYNRSVFSIEYKIYRNNGTFRKDIGEGSKKQYITLTDQSGEWLVDNISTVN